jgi:hypothetical protein
MLSIYPGARGDANLLAALRSESALRVPELTSGWSPPYAA